MSTPELRSANELAQERTDLASLRTLMAADRSLMAWVRTALSMISFGFTIYKFLDALPERGVNVMNANPRTIGLFLIGLGTLSILAGILDYRHAVMSLHMHRHPAIRRPAFAIALVLATGGVFLFVSVLARVL